MGKRHRPSCCLEAAQGRYGGHLSGRARDACVIGDNDFALLGEAVKDGRIPIVQIAVEVVIENKRQAAPLAPTPVRETNAVRLNKRVGAVIAV